MKKLQELFSGSSDIIAIVDLVNSEKGTSYEDGVPCLSLDFPKHDNEFNDSWLMCKGDYINEFLNTEYYADTEDASSIDLEQELFKYVTPPIGWAKYIDELDKPFGITFKDPQFNNSYVYVVPIKDNWEEIYKKEKEADEVS
jgi:hypothetical protein